jgi:hypothetical protein
MVPKIFPHNDEPGDALGLGLSGPPVLTSRRRTSSAASSQLYTATQARQQLRTDSPNASAGSLSPIVLTLPDESAAPASHRTRGADLPNLLSWAAIILGALVAAALIWTAPKSTSPPPDIAPAWESPVDHRASTNSAPAWQPAGGSDSSNQAPPPPDEPVTPGDWNHAGGPRSTVDESAAQDGIRTARAAEAPRAEAFEPSAPSEAAPTGRITNVAVPQ